VSNSNNSTINPSKLEPTLAPNLNGGPGGVVSNSNSVPKPDIKAFSTPISSPNPKALFYTSKPEFSARKSNYLSPLSPKSTPFKSPSTSSGNKYSPSKSPHSPLPFSPLDEQRFMQRQKQIDYGYRTVGYLRYRLLIGKDQRRPEHPRTPKKTQGCSKRSWDGQLKKWRRDLHLWDPDNVDAFKSLLNSDLVVSIIAANPELAEIVDIVREKMDNPNADYEDDYEEELSYEPPQPQPQLPLQSTIITTTTDIKATVVLVQKGLNNNTEKIPSPPPPRMDEDAKIQSKVARTLVF